MNFKAWFENTELIDRKYLFNIGMSHDNIRGELVRALDAIEGKYVSIKPGTLGVLVDKGSDYYIVIVATGMLGFAPIKTDIEKWELIGKQFSGNYKQFVDADNESQGIVDLSQFNGWWNKKPGVTAVFDSEKQIRIILFEKPLGPDGYRSKYQIILNNLKPQMVTVITVAKGSTRTITVNPDHVKDAVEGAITFVRMNKEGKI